MKNCIECKAVSDDARTAIMAIPSIAEGYVTDADEIANVLNIDIEEAQLALNCLLCREFGMCSPESVYNDN